MKVFISWSGKKSELVAIEIRNWLSSMFQSLEIWISTRDISPGARWHVTLSKALEQSSIGIICLAKDNLNSNWLLFEAGAISKAVDESRLVPLLIDLEKNQLTGPLSFFQTITLQKEELYNLAQTINQLNNSNFRDQKIFDLVFEKWWSDLDYNLNKINNTNYPTNKGNIRIVSTREISIILLLQEGKTLKEIANELFVSVGTVQAHFSNIKAKLGANSREEIIRFAQYHELI